MGCITVIYSGASVKKMQFRDRESKEFWPSSLPPTKRAASHFHYAERRVNSMPERRPDNSKVYLVGGGIVSLAAAAFLIRDGNIPGHNLTIP